MISIAILDLPCAFPKCDFPARRPLSAEDIFHNWPHNGGGCIVAISRQLSLPITRETSPSAAVCPRSLCSCVSGAFITSLSGSDQFGSFRTAFGSSWRAAKRPSTVYGGTRNASRDSSRIHEDVSLALNDRYKLVSVRRTDRKFLPTNRSVIVIAVRPRMSGYTRGITLTPCYDSVFTTLRSRRQVTAR